MLNETRFGVGPNRLAGDIQGNGGDDFFGKQTLLPTHCHTRTRTEEGVTLPSDPKELRSPKGKYGNGNMVQNEGVHHHRLLDSDDDFIQ